MGNAFPDAQRIKALAEGAFTYIIFHISADLMICVEKIVSGRLSITFLMRGLVSLEKQLNERRTI